MRKIGVSCGALALCVSGLVAQTPSLTGVWKANLDASTFGRMKPTDYMMIIQQQGNTVRETIGDTNMMGVYRSAFTFTMGTQESRNSWRGMPMHSKAQWTNGALIVDSRIAGPRAQTLHDKYSLSADGNTLTIESVATREGKDTQQTIVLTRQPDDAGGPLRQPEATAGQRFKNVKMLGDMPASRFLDTMTVFSASLGQHCEFCHVERDFVSDDKEQKMVARHMIEMTNGLNEQSFNGRAEVRCYTCHRGAEKPVSAPE
jgi:Photosynthetic reaction centre cytochrome C subunit